MACQAGEGVGDIVGVGRGVKVGVGMGVAVLVGVAICINRFKPHPIPRLESTTSNRPDDKKDQSCFMGKPPFHESSSAIFGPYCRKKRQENVKTRKRELSGLQPQTFFMFQRVLTQSHRGRGVFAGANRKFLCVLWASVRKCQGFCRFCWVLKKRVNGNLALRRRWEVVLKSKGRATFENRAGAFAVTQARGWVDCVIG